MLQYASKALHKLEEQYLIFCLGPCDLPDSISGSSTLGPERLLPYRHHMGGYDNQAIVSYYWSPLAAIDSLRMTTTHLLVQMLFSFSGLHLHL
eukprot:g41479.t1